MTRAKKKKPARNGALYRAMVTAVRAWVRAKYPTRTLTELFGEQVNLIDVVAYTPGGAGETLAAFHFDPTDPDRRHDFCHGGDGTAKKCPHCRGDRRAAEGGAA